MPVVTLPRTGASVDWTRFIVFLWVALHGLRPYFGFLEAQTLVPEASIDHADQIAGASLRF
jgi:hypothetical protein